MDIHLYLRLCYDVLNGKKRNKITVLDLCATHMLKTIRESLKDQTKDRGLRALSLRLFAIVQTTTCLKSALYCLFVLEFYSPVNNEVISSRSVNSGTFPGQAKTF